tara:strand:- start:4140 stop:5987 length:1848 start_codon:yes stop_codon:yes gene_type:complete
MYKYPNVDKLLSRRIFLLTLAKGVLFTSIFARLTYLQLIKTKEFKVLADKNRISLRLISPLRGRILDRNNQILASNINSYNLYIHSVKNVDEFKEILGKINKIIFISNEEIKNTFNIFLNSKKKDLPVIVKKNLKWNEVSSISVNLLKISNIFIDQGIRREYPHNDIASHIIGYMSPPNKKDIKKEPVLGMLDINTGQFGVEKSFEKDLRGFPGTRHVEVNAFGNEIREIRKEKSINGNDIKLTIDIKLQKYINTLLKDKSGSVVIIDVKNGELLGIESSPSFNPNLFTSFISKKDWDTLINDPMAPLLNKSIAGEYSPGSTFKLIVLYSALQNNIFKTNNKIKCSSKLNYGDRNFYCWCHKKKIGCWASENHERNVNPELAIAQSCDSFFYELAKRVGIDNIAKTANLFGLGFKSDLGLDGEKNGLVPNKNWHKRKNKKNWQIGETMITGVGQGYITTTPLQLARMTAIIAKNGKKVFPSIFKNIKDFEKRDNDEDTDNNNDSDDKKFFSLIKKGMFSTVNKYFGTAYKSRLSKPIFAGKTGTVQVRTISEAERFEGIIPNKDLPIEQRDHALFVGFAPYKNPKIALSVVIEHGGSGSKVAAPIAKKIFKKLLA